MRTPIFALFLLVISVLTLGERAIGGQVRAQVCGKDERDLSWPDDLRDYASANKCAPVQNFCKANFGSHQWQYGYGVERGNKGAVLLCQEQDARARYFVLVRIGKQDRELLQCPKVIPLNFKPGAIAILDRDQMQNLWRPEKAAYLGSTARHPPKTLKFVHTGVEVTPSGVDIEFSVFYCDKGSWVVSEGLDS